MTLLQDVSMTLIREDVSMALLHILIRAMTLQALGS